MDNAPLQAGFAGLGQMGLPMVRHLSLAAIPTIVYDPNPAASDAAAQFRHVTVAPTLADVARGCRVLFTCLPTQEVVREVYLGTTGIGASAKSGLITCESSTITPALAAELHAAMAEHGVSHLDAPVFGTPAHAEDGKLYFLLSGSPEPIKKIELYLQAMGRGHRFVGGTGKAYLIKLIQNALGFVNAVATAEALAICKRTDIDLLTFVDVVKECDGIGNSTYFNRHAETVARGEDGGTGRLLIGAKDMALLGEIVATTGLDAPLMKHTEHAYAAACEAGLAGAEYTEVARVIETRLGERLFYSDQAPGKEVER